MRILIAEDDSISRRILQATLQRYGHDVISTVNGTEAWDALTSEQAPRLAILDWMMPEMDGLEVCRRIRYSEDVPYVYVILLTSRARKGDIVRGFEAGVDDYLTKPFDAAELRARLAVGQRILDLEEALSTKVVELKAALAHVKQLQGLLPICMHCKKIRDDHATWHRMETYIQKHSGALFTHSLCNECLVKHYPQHQKQVSAKQDNSG